MNDENDRMENTKADVEAAAGEPEKGGFTKRQLWVAPIVMAVNLPGSVFAQVSPVGAPTGAPTVAAPTISAPSMI